MITEQERARIISRGRPSTTWEGEPLLGSTYGEEEIEAAVGAIRESIDINKGFGFSSDRIVEFEQAFASYVGTRYAVALNSAGPGLDLMMRYLRLQPDDEVIVPAINFVAAPMAVVCGGGRIVWAEVDEATLQLDPEDVERRITARTRAIFPVHMNGLSAPMDDLYDVAERHAHPIHGPIPVIGDAARACGGEYRDTKIGKRGLATVFSFHTMKNMTTLGEGGMVTTDDERVAAFCRSARFYGFETDEWGTSNVMTKVQAAVGLVQLKKLDGFIAARRRLAMRRHDMLRDVPELSLPLEPADCIHSYYLYTCLVDESWAGERRDKIIAMMAEDYGVKLLIANKPVYEVRPFMRRLTEGQSLPRSERIGARLFCVPIHPAMSDDDNEYIAASLIECIARLR